MHVVIAKRSRKKNKNKNKRSMKINISNRNRVTAEQNVVTLWVNHHIHHTTRCWLLCDDYTVSMIAYSNQIGSENHWAGLCFVDKICWNTNIWWHTFQVYAVFSHSILDGLYILMVTRLSATVRMPHFGKNKHLPKTHSRKIHICFLDKN